jgi:hypothetical protein
VLDKQLNDNKFGIAVVYIIGLEVCYRVILVVVVDILFYYCYFLYSFFKIALNILFVYTFIL